MEKEGLNDYELNAQMPMPGRGQVIDLDNYSLQLDQPPYDSQSFSKQCRRPSIKNGLSKQSLRDVARSSLQDPLQKNPVQDPSSSRTQRTKSSNRSHHNRNGQAIQSTDGIVTVMQQAHGDDADSVEAEDGALVNSELTAEQKAHER